MAAICCRALSRQESVKMATQCRLSLPFDCVTFYDCLCTLIVLFFGAHITGFPPPKISMYYSYSSTWITSSFLHRLVLLGMCVSVRLYIRRYLTTLHRLSCKPILLNVSSSQSSQTSSLRSIHVTKHKHAYSPTVYGPNQSN